MIEEPKYIIVLHERKERFSFDNKEHTLYYTLLKRFENFDTLLTKELDYLSLQEVLDKKCSSYLFTKSQIRKVDPRYLDFIVHAGQHLSMMNKEVKAITDYYSGVSGQNEQEETSGGFK